MPRSGADARYRLQLAALDLFERNGFEATTTAMIAARAGLTERTYFRHFADKREVLFEGEQELRAALAKGVDEAPPGSQPMAVIIFALRSVAPLIEQNRPFSEPRRSVISRTPALQERLSAKTSRLVATLSGALRSRGVETAYATMAAEIGVAVLHNAANGWLDDAGSAVVDHVDRAYAKMKSLTQ